MFFLLPFCLLSSLLFASVSSTVKQPYVVYMGARSSGGYDSLSDNVDIESVKNTQRQFLSSFLSSEENENDVIVNQYAKNINGFTAMLDENQVAEMKKRGEVVSVFLNKGKHLHTTHSWDFMNLEIVNKDSKIAPRPRSLWRDTKFGEDIIIANIDTGVWPESRSFSGDGYGPVPARWKGLCRNDTVNGVSCNNKLIGAKFFDKGYRSSAGNRVPKSLISSARDYEGHGSHTLSTAGGNFVPNASVDGVGTNTAKGGSPKARVASYKVCWPKFSEDMGPCSEADILEALDAAIHDGVDVLSLSLGGDPSDYLEDAITIGGFHAVKKGIVMVLSAGNSGLGGDWTAQNLAPWLLTVAASTIDREFQSLVKLGNGQTFGGASLTKSLPKDEMYPVISAGDAAGRGVSPSDALLCMNGTLDPMKVKGKLLVCLRGQVSRLEKFLEATQAGAVGLILCNDKTTRNYITPELQILPTSNVNYTSGLAIFEYLNSTKKATASISAATENYGVKPSPSMAYFSSKGPNKLTPGILKPDVTAPGVNIVASYTGSKSPTQYEFDTRRVEFYTMSGTSMSCPHVAGVAGLLKKIHPDWSPAAIKSAIMTTAKTRDNTGKPMVDSNLKKATPFDYGAGHIQPNRASDPGLVYDLTIADHLNFLCAQGYNQSVVRIFSGVRDHKCSKTASILNYNYPSITIPDLSKPVTVTRTLKNVGQPGTYVSRVRSPTGISVRVQPPTLRFERIGEEKTFEMKIRKQKGVKMNTEEFVFGELLWSDKVHKVKSPVVIGFGMQPGIPSPENIAAAYSRNDI